MRKSRGFTIVELLIVIVVVGILAAITIVAYNGIQQRAQTATMQSDLTNASTLLKLDQITNGGYPITLAAANSGKGVNSSPDDSLYYQYNNVASPQTFCITARNDNAVYKISNNSAPTAGGCLTNGVAEGGLVMNLDAGNQASYSGTGTSWLDLSDNANNFTLVNGPTYNVANGGSIAFDGVNDILDFNAPGLSNVATIEMWVKSSDCSNKMFFGWDKYDLYCSNGAIGYNTGNSDIYGINAATVTSLGAIGNWKDYTLEMHSDVPYTNNKIYVNGVAQPLSQILGVENSLGANFNNGQGRISGWRYGGYMMSENVSVFRIYNRILSPTEINQNFNTLRGRYGI